MTSTSRPPGESEPAPNPEHDPEHKAKHPLDKQEAKKMQSQLKPRDNFRHPTQWTKAEQVLWWIHRTSGLTAQTPAPPDPPDCESDTHSETETPAAE